MLEQIENPVCTVVLVSPYFEMKGNIFLTSLPSSIHEQKFELWQLVNLYRIVDGFAQNRIHKLDASQARSLIILSKILQGYWSTVHVNRDYSLLTLIQKHSHSLKQGNNTPVTLRQRYNFTLDFLVVMHTGVGLQPPRLSSILY